MGNPPLGVPPGELAHEDAMRIFGVINVLSDRRRFGNAFATRKKLLSGDDGEPKNQPPRTPEPESNAIVGCEMFQRHLTQFPWGTHGHTQKHNVSCASKRERYANGTQYSSMHTCILYTDSRQHEPVEFFRAISSALDVFRWSIRKLGMLNGGTCMLSDENWCLNGRCRSGDGIDKLSNFSLLRCCRSMWSNISCKTYFETNVIWTSHICIPITREWIWI